MLRHVAVFSSGSINHLSYSTAPLVALHTICFRKVVVLLGYLRDARYKCNAGIFTFNILSMLKNTTHDLLLD